MFMWIVPGTSWRFSMSNTLQAAVQVLHQEPHLQDLPPLAVAHLRAVVKKSTIAKTINLENSFNTGKNKNIMEQKRNTNSTGALKVLVAASTVFGSISLWAMFSNKSIEITNQKLAAQNSTAKVMPVSQQVVANTPFQPSPTATATSVPALRVVNIDFGNKTAPVQPAVQTIVINTGGSSASSGSGSSGGSSAAAPAPVTNTKTS
jgi:hypothetical protein